MNAGKLVNPTRTHSRWEETASRLFWSWNLIFLAFIGLGYAPRALPELLPAVRAGVLPAEFLIQAVLMTLVPVAAVVLGLTVLRRSPGRLFALGYVVEWPLMLMLAVRLFLLRELTPAVTGLLVMAILGLVTFTWEILDRKIDQRSLALAWLRVIGLSLLVFVTIYASLWVLFYVLPLLGAAWNGLVYWFSHLAISLRNLVRWFGNFWQTDVRWIPFQVLGTLVFLYSATLFVLLPVAAPILVLRAWRLSIIALQAQVNATLESPAWEMRRPSAAWGRIAAWGTAGAILVLAFGSLWITSRQPQAQVFSLLERLPSSPAEAQALLNRSEEIRAGLLNAYLAPFRYIGSVGEVQHIRDIYRDVFHFTIPQAERVQQWYETLTRPLLYAPAHPPAQMNPPNQQALNREPQEAARLYQQFFDQPINDGEHPQVIRAVQSTTSVSRAQAALQAVDDRAVYLKEQEIQVIEQGDWAEVELYEVYQNQTGDLQEVVYYFNLPESAVVTGLWLGNTPAREARYIYHVAPRGAAQAVYRNEFQRSQDPALIEQIGPRQYRLRIFPVPSQQITHDPDSGRATVEAGAPLYLWLTYRTLAQDNAWPLPQLADKRNVYWDADTARRVNGVLIRNGAAWLPPSIPAAATIQPAAHRVGFPSGETVLAVPTSAQTASSELALSPSQALHLAVVLDRSRSMEALSFQVRTALDQARQADPQADLYLTASPYRGEPPSLVPLAQLDPAQLQFYGGQNAAELLQQFGSLRQDRAYSAILVLTDSSGYELGKSPGPVPVPPEPVWMVHLGQQLPLGYDDATLEAIQASGGGAAASVNEALTRLLAQNAGLASVLGLSRPGGAGNVQSLAPLLPAGSQVDLLDGYLWVTSPGPVELSEEAVVEPPSGPFAALAARRIILAEMHRQRANLSDPAALDPLHALAIEHSIVTPYSSMLVLVDSRQEGLLKRLADDPDRFAREMEGVGETLPGNPFMVSGVPEPQEWLLMGAAAALLAWYLARRQKFNRRFLIFPKIMLK